MPTRPLVFLLAVSLFTAGPLTLTMPTLAPGGSALADDDDDGGGGGGGGGSDDDDDGPRRQVTPRGSLSDLFPFLRQRPAPQRRAAPPPAPAPPPPEFAANEIVTLGLSAPDLATLVAQGFDVLEETDLPGLSATPRRLSVPPGVTLAAARDTVRALSSGQDADFNHFYRSEQGFSTECRGAECPARQMIDWPVSDGRDTACGSSVPIGMIDTGINAEHETFSGARIDILRLGDEVPTPSQALHGTAVAALLVGEPTTRSPGLVPGAKLVAVDAFYRSGSDERADVFTLVQALALLAEARVRVINLSLAGPDNTVLAEIVDRLVLEQDIALVAAVGNSGPRAAPEFPAAYDHVIAVTAVDRDGAVYRRAIQGAHVDLAAPGVNIWTAASISGARWKTGTSFAVPFVTAAAAMLRETRPVLGAAKIGATLRDGARDLGDPGPDPVYGAGLLDIAGLCTDPT